MEQIAVCWIIDPAFNRDGIVWPQDQHSTLDIIDLGFDIPSWKA